MGRPREHPRACSDIAALDTAPDARRFFGGLRYAQQKEYARWVDSAKRPETRERRLAETVALLAAGRKQH